MGEFPNKYKDELLGRKVLEHATPFGSMPRKAAPKPRGTTGPTPHANLLASGIQPSPQFLPQQSAVMLFGGEGGSTPMMVMPVLSSPARKALGLPSPEKPRQAPFVQGMHIKKWLRRLDEGEKKLEEDDQTDSDVKQETYMASYPGLARLGVKYVSDILHLTAEEIRDEVGCSRVMARKLFSRAQIEMEPKRV